MGKKSKKNKKDKHYNNEKSSFADTGDADVVEVPSGGYGAVEQHMMALGQRSPGQTHELHESEYYKMCDDVDEKEKVKLRKQAARRRADSEAEDYDEKKEKRKAILKAKQKKQQAEEKILKKKRDQLAEIEGTNRPVKLKTSKNEDGDDGEDRSGSKKRKKKKKKGGREDGGGESSNTTAATKNSTAHDKPKEVEMYDVYKADHEVAEAENLTHDQNRCVQNEILNALNDEGRNFVVTAVPDKKEEQKRAKDDPAPGPIQSFKQTLYQMYPSLKKTSEPIASIMPARKYLFQDSFDRSKQSIFSFCLLIYYYRTNCKLEFDICRGFDTKLAYVQQY